MFFGVTSASIFLSLSDIPADGAALDDTPFVSDATNDRMSESIDSKETGCDLMSDSPKKTSILLEDIPKILVVRKSFTVWSPDSASDLSCSI